jgi:hypothetical protein
VGVFVVVCVAMVKLVSFGDLVSRGFFSFFFLAAASQVSRKMCTLTCLVI